MRARSSQPAKAASAAREPRPTDADAVVFRGDGEPKSIASMIQQLQVLNDTEPVVLDVFGLGGIVEKLEKRCADALGKEAAIFMPTGTLANHLALRALCGNRPRALVQEQSHLNLDTGDCATQLSGLSLVPLGNRSACFDLAGVREVIEAGSFDRVMRPVGALMIETPVRRQHGLVVPYETIIEITDYCRGLGIGTHLDGARLYMMSAATGIPPRQYASHFDTVYVSLYKYFGAPFGAILAGPSSLLAGMHHTRRMFGSGLNSMGLAAALAYRGMDGFEQRFAEAMAKASQLIHALQGQTGLRVERITSGSNLFPIEFDRWVDRARLIASLRSRSVFLFPDDGDPGAYHLSINTTLLRQSNEAIVSAFAEAIAAAGSTAGA